MNTDDYRIKGKENVNCHGPKTTFALYEFDDEKGAYVYQGLYGANGWDASDEACIDAALKSMQQE